jgi:hypothetical protein
MDLPSMGSMPGMSTLTQSTETQVLWGGSQAKVLYDTDNVVGSAAVDAGSSPTTVLRAGLILGRQTSDHLLYQWDPLATDGTEVPVGVLLNSISMLNAAGAVENKDVGAQGVAIIAPVKAANLTILGTAFTSSAYEYIARQLLRVAVHVRRRSVRRQGPPGLRPSSHQSGGLHRSCGRQRQNVPGHCGRQLHAADEGNGIGVSIHPNRRRRHGDFVGRV